MTDAVIRRLADAQSYQRGLDYASHGHVESLEDRSGSVDAFVRGNQDYTVTLTADDGVLDYSCDCPVGSDGAFCKHCVAVALAWLNRASSYGVSRSSFGGDGAGFASLLHQFFVRNAARGLSLDQN